MISTTTDGVLRAGVLARQMVQRSETARVCIVLWYDDGGKLYLASDGKTPVLANEARSLGSKLANLLEQAELIGTRIRSHEETT